MKILIVLIILNLASFYFINNTSIVYTILGITVVMYLLVVNFFRFPNRVIIQDDNTILAPADGKIVVIEETEEPAPEEAAAQPEQSAEPAEPQAPADDTPEQPEAENDQKEEE